MKRKFKKSSVDKVEKFIKKIREEEKVQLKKIEASESLGVVKGLKKATVKFESRKDVALERTISGIAKRLKEQVKVRRFLKPSKRLTVVIKQKQTPIVLNDPNRFFKREIEEVKKTLFFE